jgi:primosomal replication protein N
MGACVNIVVLSGEIAWVKHKYTKTGKMWVSFALKQGVVEYEDKKIVSISYELYFCSCFDETMYMHNSIKEGAYATVQGRLNVYKDKGGKFAFTIVAEKIDINGLQKGEG